MPHLSGPLSFLILLAVLVAVHEFGHFIVAKWLGVKVLKFSIGFGPKILGFTKGETEYKISLLPLGGYVKMAGEVPGEEVSPEDLKRSFLHQAPWKRFLIVAAGPAVNLVFPILVYFFVFLGSTQAIAPKLAAVEPGLPAAQAGLLAGDRVLAIDGQPVQTFEEIRDRLKNLSDKPTQVTVDRNGEQLTKTVIPAVGFEVDPMERVPQGFLGIGATKRPPIVGVQEKSPAHAAGLRTFDRVISLNGQPVKDEEALLALAKGANGNLDLHVLRSSELALPGVSAEVQKTVRISVPHKSGEELLALGVERHDLYISKVVKESPAFEAGLAEGDRVVEADGKPIQSSLQLSLILQRLSEKPFRLKVRRGDQERTLALSQRKLKVKDELGNEVPVVQPGFLLGSRTDVEQPEMEKVTVHIGPAEALRRSFKILPEVIRKTALVIPALLTGKVPFASVGGPIMMYQLASRAAEVGINRFLELMAVISVNLGIMNLLPIPVLDGFGLLSAVWEGIRRKPIPLRAREIANMVGLAMLVLLMLAVMRNDVTRLINGG